MTNGKLSPATVIPIGTAALVLFSILGGARWMDRKFLSLEYEVKILKSEVATMRTEIANQIDDRWRRGDMRAWSEILGARNPSMSIPNVGDN